MTDKTVLITGCSTGIGRATAALLSNRGWTVYASARKISTLEGLDGCKHIALDVDSDESMRVAISSIEKKTGPLYALVNNAGYSQSGAVLAVTDSEAKKQFQTNVFGLAELTRLATASMIREGRGRVVNVSSMGGRLTLPGGGWYHATKHAVEALSDAMRYELAPFGVAVSVVQPGLIATEFGATAHGATPTKGGGVWSVFNHAVANMTAAAYSAAPMKWMAASPNKVAHAIASALESPQPRSRYPVTLHARAGMFSRRFIPDGIWDFALSLGMPRPKVAPSKKPT